MSLVKFVPIGLAISGLPPYISSRFEAAARSLLRATLFFCVFTAMTEAALGQVATSVNVPTWRYDNTEAGANIQETLLTPTNVTGSSFGLLFSRSVDGYVYAQPLYINGLTMTDGLVHNVVFVATEHDSVYAFDADSNAGTNAQPLWQISLLNSAYGAAPGATTVPSADVDSNDIVPEIGITSTPAINVTGNTMYVIGKTKEGGGYVQRLHAINILTGAEQPNSPTVIQATALGTGAGSSGGQIAFSPLWQLNRAALSYYNGIVYAGFGSHGDNGPWHGWLLAFDGTTLAQTGAICLSPSGSGAGVWESGAGMPIDNGGTSGRMFFSTGNGLNTPFPPFNPSVNLGDSVVEVSLSGGSLAVTDAFTTFNQAALSAADHDLGSGGVLLLPDRTGPNPHLLIQAGKEGRIVVLDRDNLGGYLPGGTSNTNALQDILGATTGIFSTPAYWNGSVYIWGTGDYPKAFSLNNGVLASTSSSRGTITSGFPGASFVISSNGTQNGIAWAVRQTGGTAPEVLYAFDATDLSKVLYESDKQPRDNPGLSNKFVVPIVTNGKVYVGAQHQLDVFGLLNGEPVAAVPTFIPNGGVFDSPQQIWLSTATPSTNIFYTLDGTAPTTGSNLYTSPIWLTAATTVKAMASGTNYLQSSITSAAFTPSPLTPLPVFTPAGGTYNSAQQVVLSDRDSSATIYYTLDGSTPTTSSAVYSSPIAVGANTTISALAVDPARLTNHAVAGAYVIQPGSSSINFGSGFSTATGITFNGSATTSSDACLLLTSGGVSQAGSAFYNVPIDIRAFTADFAFQLINPQADGFTFTIQNAKATALGSNGSALGYASTKAMPTSVAVKFDFHNNSGEGDDSTGFYIDGAMPTIPAVDMTSSGVILKSGNIMQAHLSYDGTTLTLTLTDIIAAKTFIYSQAINIPQIVGANTAYVGFTGGSGGSTAIQKILTWTYSASVAAVPPASPTFSPPSGSYTTTQNIALSDTTSGAAIYYTMDGTTPTTSSSVYSNPIAVNAGTTTTFEALGVAPSGLQSAVTTATYVISAAVPGVTAVPTFSPAPGTYASAQSITLSDSTAGSVIYYTVDGTTPSTSSSVYSSPILVGSTETIQAVAIAPGLSASSVSSGGYTISPTTEVINFPNGFAGAASSFIFNGVGILSGSTLQMMTASQTSSRSSIWFTPAVNIATFTTDFDFQILNGVADGFTFAIQTKGPLAIGSTGNALGYGGGISGIGKSLAIKFDIHNNSGEGSDSTGFYTDGAQPTIPSMNLTPSNVILTSGHILHAHVTYDGTNLTLTLTDTTTSASFTATEAVNLASVLGGTTAYLGFTAGSGGSSMNANILDWTYHN
ncbi:chitobiase/beta-hexosaminidase C-terminal domain-containing protein [Tunturibacter empetritectus]|uniref:Chitobiase/beta-hexosaminidase C-terminal domain-containing protein n=1 Tax=Tunturiibacter empetritectus TaxID=3069691 RepID=A0AAU7ZCX3_9BACT